MGAQWVSTGFPSRSNMVSDQFKKGIISDLGTIEFISHVSGKRAFANVLQFSH